MRILALETDIEKLNKSFLSPNEHQVLKVRFHGIRFLFAILKAILYTVILVGIAILSAYGGIPTNIVIIAACILWIPFIGFPLLRGWIDWQYDELVLTSEKIIVVDQSSIVRQAIIQMNLDNVASVRAETQYWGIMPFGKLYFDLKEGTGQRYTLSYIPQAQRVASVISDAMVKFERRRATRAL